MPMSSVRRSFSFTAIAAIALFALAGLAQAQEVASNQNYTIKIKNFGRMDDRFYRGSQPKEEADYQALAALGIKTVIDLTDDPKDFEKSMVEAAGMRYVHIPMVAKKYPTPESVAAFLKTVDDPTTGKFYLHCAGGRHRTGAMGAVYRYNYYHWNFDQVYKEMKQYDFYTSWGHGAFKDFVRDYEQKLAHHASTPAPEPAAAGAEQRR